MNKLLMETSFYTVLALGAASFSAAAMIWHLYMFQLNHYIHTDHWRWMLHDLKRLRTVLFALAAGAAAVWCGAPFARTADMWKGECYGALAAGAVLIVGALVTGKSAFAKLKYTRRVKTLIVTAALFEAAVAALMRFVCFWGYSESVALGCALIPWIVMLSDWVDWPIEHGFRAYYIRDAKKLLARNPDLIVVGITGSYGKTSMKYFLSSLLGLKYDVLMPPGSCNTPMGIVKFIRENITLSHEIFVCEMGARRVGEIKEICDLVNPRHGVITAVGEQHLETFKSIENVRRTKFELAEAVPEVGMVFLNGDNQFMRDYDLQKPHLYYGLNENDWRAEEVAETPFVSFTAVAPDGRKTRIETKLLGRHNVLNLIGAIAVADYLGVSLEAIAAHAKKITAPSKRLTLAELPEATYIDDAFNSNPEGCMEALHILSLFKDECRVLVTPGMFELGAKQYEYNRDFGAAAGKVCDAIILIGEEQSRPIADGVRSTGFPEERLFIVGDLAAAKEKLANFDDGTKRRKAVLFENNLPDNH